MSLLAALITSALSSAAPPPAPPPSVSGPVKVQRARPLGDYAMLIREWDYPVQAAAAGEEGRVGYLLDIGPDGRVTACSITRSSGSAALDEGTCRLLSRRARFAPARGPSGEPLADRAQSTIDWRLDDPVLITSADQLPGLITSEDHPIIARFAPHGGTVGIRLVFAGHRVSSCVITETSGVTALDVATCSLMRNRASVVPKRGGKGKPKAITMASRIVWPLPPAGTQAATPAQ